MKIKPQNEKVYILKHFDPVTKLLNMQFQKQMPMDSFKGGIKRNNLKHV